MGRANLFWRAATQSRDSSTAKYKHRSGNYTNPCKISELKRKLLSKQKYAATLHAGLPYLLPAGREHLAN